MTDLIKQYISCFGIKFVTKSFLSELKKIRFELDLRVDQIRF